MLNARKYAGEMLRDRGYDIAERVSDVPMSDFKVRLVNADIDLYARAPDGRQAYVHFQSPVAAKKLSASTLEKETAGVLARLAEPDATQIVLVVVDPLQSNVQLLMKQPRYANVEVFTYDALQFNPTKHCLVPKHEVVPAEHEAAVLEQVNIERRAIFKEMQRLLSSDPIARWLGMRTGQICRITRVSEQTGFHTVFRVVQ